MFSKISTKALTKFLTLVIMLLLVATTGVLAQSSGQQSMPKPKVGLLLPKAGEAFSPGQKIKITWKVDLPPKIDLSWCEQEIFLSIDGGKTFQYRITPELSPTLRFYEWTVPNLPTEQAVLDIRFGSEFSQMRFEKSKPQTKMMFRILPQTNKVEEVKLTISTTEKLLPGDEFPFSWISSVDDLAHFEVLISYDQGAHFHSLAQIKDDNFAWTVPNNFSGMVSFKVVAHKLDGSTIESLLDTQPLVVTRGQ